jgi:hypothetical protein
MHHHVGLGKSSVSCEYSSFLTVAAIERTNDHTTKRHRKNTPKKTPQSHLSLISSSAKAEVRKASITATLSNSSIYRESIQIDWK